MSRLNKYNHPLQSDLQKICEKLNVSVNITAEELTDLDSDVTISGVLSDADIINGVTGCVKIEDYEADHEDVPEEDMRLSNPSYAEVVKAISIVECYSILQPLVTISRKHFVMPKGLWKWLTLQT